MVSLRLRFLSILFSLSFMLLPEAHSSFDDLKSFRTKDFFITTQPSGCQAKGMKAEVSGKRLFVAEMCGRRETLPDGSRGAWYGSVSVYDLINFKLETVIRTPNGSSAGIIGNAEVEISLDQNYALVTRAEGGPDSNWYPDYGMVSVIDVNSSKIIKYIPVRGKGAKSISRRPVLADDAEKRQIVYVANYFSDDLSVLDITGLQDDGNMDGSAHFFRRVRLTSQFKNPSTKYASIAPRGVAFSADGKYAVILGTETGSLIIMDAVNHRQLVELAPIDNQVLGRPVNVRHIVTTKDGQFAYLSHMRGNGVSRISMVKLIELTQNAVASNQKVLPAEAWSQIFVPFQTEQGPQNILVLEKYPDDHNGFVNLDGMTAEQKKKADFSRLPRVKRETWPWAHPNTIVLDPIQERYLFVSSRTTTDADYNVIDLRLRGKVDIIDTTNGKIVFTLVAGAQPTALEVTPDRKTLVSGGFKDEKIYFYDLQKILSIYENQKVRTYFWD